MPSLKSFWTNMSGPQPWPTKLRLLARNMWIRVVKQQDCCGHPGEPGC